MIQVELPVGTKFWIYSDDGTQSKYEVVESSVEDCDHDCKKCPFYSNCEGKEEISLMCTQESE